ncbi:MAG: hypothetical protein V2I27_05345, partial [Erythrobacter sp.]|nr:hypothetical protein [Erythrobacter sp.]
MRTHIWTQRSLALLLSSCAFVTPFAAQAEAAMQESVEDNDDETDAPQERQSSLDAIGNIVVTGTKTQNVENVQDVA